MLVLLLAHLVLGVLLRLDVSFLVFDEVLVPGASTKVVELGAEALLEGLDELFVVILFFIFIVGPTRAVVHGEVAPDEVIVKNVVVGVIKLLLVLAELSFLQLKQRLNVVGDVRPPLVVVLELGHNDLAHLLVVQLLVRLDNRGLRLVSRLLRVFVACAF